MENQGPGPHRKEQGDPVDDVAKDISCQEGEAAGAGVDIV